MKTTYSVWEPVTPETSYDAITTSREGITYEMVYWFYSAAAALKSVSKKGFVREDWDGYYSL